MKHIAIYHNLPSGGAKRALFEWTRHLSHTHIIDVYSLSTADHDFCDLRPHVNRYQIYDWEPSPLFSSPFGRLNALQRWRDLHRLEGLNRKIAADINQQPYDLLFANPCMFTQIPPLVSSVNKPTIYYLHEPVGAAIQREITRPYLKPAGGMDRIDPFFNLYHHKFNQMVRQNLLQIQILLANSQFTLQCMQQTFPLRHSEAQERSLCYLGVDTQAFHPLPGDRRKPGLRWSEAVLSVGELTPRKGFDFLIDSLSRIPSSVRPPLRIASNWENPAEKAYLQQLAAQKGVTLHLLGRLSTEELCLEYNQAALCLYAPIQEPFGLVPLEAMACGTPVVGVAEGGLLETIQHQVTGLLLAREPDLFATALRQLLADPDQIEKFGQQARVFILENWNWDLAVEHLKEHLERPTG